MAIAFGTILLFVDIIPTEDPKSKGGLPFAIIYLIFSYNWTAMIIKNTAHVTNSGLFGIFLLCNLFVASFYFQGVMTDGKIQIPHKNPTLTSAKRALTTSFGSIAYGSLILTLVSVLQSICGSSKREAAENQNT
jgi:hypothetical protein